MKRKLLKTYLFTENDLQLMKASHTFAASSVWLARGMDKWVTSFDLTVREFKNRNFMLFSGMEEILNGLKNFRFKKSDIRFLLKSGIITKQAAEYLENFRFTGTVHCLPEGTPFFPGEPILRITAPLIEAALAELMVMNIACSNIPFLTKAMRGVVAAQNKVTLSTGPLRGHSFESGMKACRAGYIAGMSAWVVPAFAKKYKISTSKFMVNGQHLYIKSFPNELEAMQALAEHFPNNCSFMVDTYDTRQGINNAVQVAKELEEKGGKLSSIMIDSGDLVYWCNYAREELDKNGLEYVKIAAATNMDEYKIKRLIESGIKCDILAMITEYLALTDSPKLEVVYKLAEVRKGRKITYAAKLTPGKISLPGRKQIFRLYNKKGVLIKDIIGLENEKLGKPMLIKVMENGQVTYDLPTLDEIREYTHEQIKKLPSKLLDLEKEVICNVKISGRIEKILADLRQEHIKS